MEPREDKVKKKSEGCRRIRRSCHRRIISWSVLVIGHCAFDGITKWKYRSARRIETKHAKGSHHGNRRGKYREEKNDRGKRVKRENSPERG